VKQFYEEVARRTAAGEAVATVTIIRTRGSTPREVGTKMLVTPTDLIGTVGGGCGEGEARQAALDSIADGASRIVKADLTEEISYDSRGVCGGIIEMLVEPWRDSRPAGLILDALKSDGRVAVATVIHNHDGAISTSHLIVPPSGEVLGESDGDPSSASLVTSVRAALAEGRTRTVRVEDPGSPESGTTPAADVFVEVQIPAPTLVICGAGHIAVPLVSVGKLLGFRVMVVDDRAEYATVERFPGADEVIAEDFVQALKRQQWGPDSYAVLVTRGHSYDVDCLLEIIDKPLGYIGMIGSKRRVWAVHKLLHHFGVTVDQLRRIHAPIGVDIAAETPAEIAVAIAAEIIRIRNGGSAALMSDAVRDRYAALIERGAELG
jgi:xanthine dehydrogenase accessory factor